MKTLTQHQIDSQVDIWNKKADELFLAQKISAEQYDQACLIITQWEEGHTILAQMEDDILGE